MNDKHEVLYIKKGKRYLPYGHLGDVRYSSANPVGIEMIVRDGDGASKHWHFASLEAIQKEYDWMHEAMKQRLHSDLTRLMQNEYPNFSWTGRSLSEVCEVITDCMLNNVLKDYRKKRSW